MLSREDQLTPPNKFISDNLTHKPATSQSAYENYSLGLTTAPYAINSFDKEYSESPRGQTVAATRDAIKRGNENPEVGWTQWGVNEVSNMVGQAMNPLTWALGELGGLAAKPVLSGLGYAAPEALKGFMRKPISEMMSEPFAKYVPEFLGGEGNKRTLSMGLFGQEWTKGFGIGAGASLPQDIVDNFNAETGKHDILGIAKGMGANGIFGMSIATIPFAYGVLKHNILRKLGRLPEVPGVSGEGGQPPGAPPVETPEAMQTQMTDAVLQKAVAEGKLDKESYDFWKEMQEYKNNPDSRPESREKIKTKATQYLADNDHAVDYANDTAQFEILNKDQINTLQSATVDQLVSDSIPDQHRAALSDFSVHAGIDEMRSKPEMLDGVRGYVEYADQNLANKDQILESADKLVDSHLQMEHGDMPLDQKAIYEVIKKYGDTNELPFYIPENVKAIIKKYNEDFKEYVKSLDTGFSRLKTTDNFVDHEFYHGTGSLEDIQNFDVYRTGIDSLFGGGLYITDSKEIALGYAQSRGGRKPGSGKILELKFKRQPKLIDLEKPPSDDVFKIIQETAKEYSGVDVPENLKGKNIDQIYKEIKEEFDGMEDWGLFLSQINEVLSDTYDGFLHTGGIRVGKKIKHNVVVLFGHDYFKHNQHYTKAPGDIISQRSLDLAHEFEKKHESFEKITGGIEEQIKDIEAENEKIKANPQFGKKLSLEGEYNNNKGRIAHLRKKILKIKTPMEELIDIRRALINDNEKSLKEIAKIESVNERLFQDYEKTGSQDTLNKIKENGKKIDLLNKKSLRNDYKSTPEYKRLQDLAEIWSPAKTLLDRINLESEIKSQQAYRDLAKQILDIADSNIGKMADVSKVNRYLEERTKQNVDTNHAAKVTEEEVAGQREVPAEADAIFAEQDRIVEMANHEKVTEEYTMAKEKFNEFKQSEGIFKNFIKCVLGKNNG